MDQPVDTAVPLGPELRGWLRREALPGRRIADTRPLTGGYRNPTTMLVTDDGERYVLRRYPDAHPYGNTCAAEVALIQRLAGTVPVAPVVAADPAGVLAGEPVLVTRFVPGTLVSTLLSELPAHEAAEPRARSAPCSPRWALMFSLVDMLTRPADNPVASQVIALLRTRLATA